METLSTVQQIEDYLKKIEVTYTKKTVSKITAIFNFVNKFKVKKIWVRLERKSEEWANKDERNCLVFKSENS